MDVPGRRLDDECALTVPRPQGFDTPHPGKRPRKGLYPPIDREAAQQKPLFQLHPRKDAGVKPCLLPSTGNFQRQKESSEPIAHQVA